MVPLLRASLATVLSSAAVISAMPALAASSDGVDLSARLQLALNSDDRVQALSALMAPDQATTLIERFRRFSMRFPETRWACLLYTSPSPRDSDSSRMPSSA